MGEYFGVGGGESHFQGVGAEGFAAGRVTEQGCDFAAEGGDAVFVENHHGSVAGGEGLGVLALVVFGNVGRGDQDGGDAGELDFADCGGSPRWWTALRAAGRSRRAAG